VTDHEVQDKGSISSSVPLFANMAGSGAYSASYITGNGGSFLGAKWLNYKNDR